MNREKWLHDPNKISTALGSFSFNHCLPPHQETNSSFTSYSAGKNGFKEGKHKQTWGAYHGMREPLAEQGQVCLGCSPTKGWTISVCPQYPPKHFSSISSKELCETFYMIHPWPSHSLFCSWNQMVLLCPISTCAILLFFKHKAFLSDTGTHSQRGLGPSSPYLGSMKHATAITSYAFEALLHQTVYKIITGPTEKAVPSVFASRHDLTIIANKITLITLFNDLKQGSFPLSGLMCQAPEGNHCKLLTFKN